MLAASSCLHLHLCSHLWLPVTPLCKADAMCSPDRHITAPDELWALPERRGCGEFPQSRLLLPGGPAITRETPSLCIWTQVQLYQEGMLSISTLNKNSISKSHDNMKTLSFLLNKSNFVRGTESQIPCVMYASGRGNTSLNRGTARWTLLPVMWCSPCDWAKQVGCVSSCALPRCDAFFESTTHDKA